MADEKLKEKIRQKISEVKRKKKMLGHVAITGVTQPKKHKPKKKKEDSKKQHQPGSVSIGPQGGRYVQEASGHKRYVKEGKLSGVKRFKKSIPEALQDIVLAGEIDNFIQQFKRNRKDEA